MNNLFDADNYPDQEPTTLVIGSRWVWKRSDVTSVYPTADYTLKYKFVYQSSDFDFITITASKVSAAHVVEVSKTTTQDYSAGPCLWQAIIVRDSDNEEIVISEGLTEIKNQTGEVRSHVYKTLQAIQATIEGKASNDQLSVAVNGYSLSKYSFVELQGLEKDYRIRWQQEKRAIAMRNGRSANTRILNKLGA